MELSFVMVSGIIIYHYKKLFYNCELSTTKKY
jgi:hypothetical protein